MTDLFPVTLPDQIAEVEREIEMRESVYSRMVNEHRMSHALAAWRIEVMRAVLQTLKDCHQREKSNV